MPNRNQGFTLLELSIVLLIIGLLVGGIFVGKSLIRAARLQSVISDQDRYKKAVIMFKDKYKELPGDMPNATNFWGTDIGCNTSYYTATPHTPTCNGDGDGHIGHSWNTGMVGNSGEWYHAWQQLADAGMIEGAYTGVSGAISNQSSVPGSNVPASKIIGAGFTLLYLSAPAGGLGVYWPAVYGHILGFGAMDTLYWTYAPAITPAEALAIDSKVDDGLPAYGNVMTYESSELPGCTTSDTPSLSTYKTANSSVACALAFITGF